MQYSRFRPAAHPVDSGRVPVLGLVQEARYLVSDMAYEIQPLADPPEASIRVPGSKSITNRAMIAAALAGGCSRLHGALFSDDTRYMVDGLRALGLDVRTDEAAEVVEVVGGGGSVPTAGAEL